MSNETAASPRDLDALVDVLLRRRSARFARGAHLDGGSLTFASASAPKPLTHEQEALLVFAACGITGYALSELPFLPGAELETGGGNIMTHLVGRTVPSGDAAHTNALFVINDAGTWYIRRPQDYPRGDIPELREMAAAGRYTELYERARIKVADHRVQPPRHPPFVPSFNRWSTNLPGTTYFVPVAELTALYINVMLAAFSPELGSLILDERNRFRPAGLARFTRSNGGDLNEDPVSGRVATIAHAETWMAEFAAIEQGAMLQNLGLMATALELGGFIHFAAHPYAWPAALGFRMQRLRFSRTLGAGVAARAAMRLLRRDLSVPNALGLDADGDTLLKPYCPPYYSSMDAAVRAFVAYKLGSGGTLRDPTATPWRDPAAVQATIPEYSEATIAATSAYASYVFERYGRFPSNSGPFRTVMAYQAHNLDPDFYRRFYSQDAMASGS